MMNDPKIKYTFKFRRNPHLHSACLKLVSIFLISISLKFGTNLFLCVWVLDNFVQLGLVESGRDHFHFQKLSRNFAAYSEFFSSPWWRPGLRCGELGARHPWIELQPDLRLIFLICLVLHCTHSI